MSYEGRPVLFSCGDDELLGIVTVPAQPRSAGLLVIVGGPQYRVGSHRQFLLLARKLAELGFPSFRFDYRGSGDSSGAMRSFEEVDEDLAAACAAFRGACPQVDSIVLWGLCDGASAALMSCNELPGVRGVVALNPWMRSDSTLGQTLVRHYYGQRLLKLEFWVKLVSGRLRVGRAIGEFLGCITNAAQLSTPADGVLDSKTEFRLRMLRGLESFSHPVLFILRGPDLAAREFETLTDDHSGWRSALAKASVKTQSFSSRRLRSEVNHATGKQLATLAA